jgi:hypothetical protein
MRSYPKSKVAVTVLALSLLGGCAEYMNNWDTVSFRAGDAPAGNTAIHTVSPWPPNVNNTNVQSGS